MVEQHAVSPERNRMEGGQGRSRELESEGGKYIPCGSNVRTREHSERTGRAGSFDNELERNAVRRGEKPRGMCATREGP